MAELNLFDERDENSPFLAFVRREFHDGRGTAFRRSLSRKTEVDSFLKGFRIRCPKKLAVLGEISGLETCTLPDRFVLKFAHG